MKRNRRGFLILSTAALLLVFLFSGYKIISYYITSKKEADDFNRLSKIVQYNSSLTPMYNQNKDLFGWIQIEGTVIDYPVMHTPEEPEFYLHKAFDKSYSQSGVPFLAGDCFLGCGNYLIYGHNMNNGSMFAAIVNYMDKDYRESHKNIKFSTIYEEAEYEVIAAFKTKIEENMQNGFHYYHYTDLTKEEAFNEYIKQVEELSIYDTQIKAEFGDQLLTLSTCAYHTANGRFVVVAKKVN